MTNSLQQHRQRGRLLRIVRTRRDAAQVAACRQRFQQIVQVFLVGSDLSTSEMELCLSTATGGKCSGDREQRSGESEHMSLAVLVCFLVRVQRFREEVREDFARIGVGYFHYSHSFITELTRALDCHDRYANNCDGNMGYTETQTRQADAPLCPGRPI